MGKLFKKFSDSDERKTVLSLIFSEAKAAPIMPFVWVPIAPFSEAS
jgi:hypothetical protein